MFKGRNVCGSVLRVFLVVAVLFSFVLFFVVEVQSIAWY